MGVAWRESRGNQPFLPSSQTRTRAVCISCRLPGPRPEPAILTAVSHCLTLPASLSCRSSRCPQNPADAINILDQFSGSWAHLGIRLASGCNHCVHLRSPRTDSNSHAPGSIMPSDRLQLPSLNPKHADQISCVASANNVLKTAPNSIILAIRAPYPHHELRYDRADRRRILLEKGVGTHPQDTKHEVEVFDLVHLVLTMLPGRSGALDEHLVRRHQHLLGWPDQLRAKASCIFSPKPSCLPTTPWLQTSTCPSEGAG